MVFALAALALPLTRCCADDGRGTGTIQLVALSVTVQQLALSAVAHRSAFSAALRARRSSTAAATQQAPATIPSGASETGFDAIGATSKKKKKNKPKPGDPKPAPPPPPKGRGAPQAAEGHTLLQQSVVREQYKVPDTPPRRVPVPIQDPYEPLGIRAGTFLLKPAIDITRGYDTNPSHIPNGTGTGYTVVETDTEGALELVGNT